MVEARAKLQACEPAVAQAILEGVVKREPGNGMAWRTLGSVCIRTKHLDCAEPALHKALELMPGTPQVMYNLGVVQAQRGDNDEAFAWLDRTKATHKPDLTPITTDVDLASLRDDPRFAKLLPTPADFAEPFVENVKIVGEFDGEGANGKRLLTLTGETAGEGCGTTVAVAGDVNRDGYADLIVGSWQYAGAVVSGGRAILYSGKDGRAFITSSGIPKPTN